MEYSGTIIRNHLYIYLSDSCCSKNPPNVEMVRTKLLLDTVEKNPDRYSLACRSSCALRHKILLSIRLLLFFRNKWCNSHLETNIFWIRYLADKLLKMKSFPVKRGTLPTGAQFKKILLGFLERSKHYSSATQMAFTDEMFQKYTESPSIAMQL